MIKGTSDIEPFEDDERELEEEDLEDDEDDGDYRGQFDDEEA